MTRWFESRTTARTVTLIAVSFTTGIVVCPDAANEACGGMTGTTIQRGRDVGRVGLRFHADRGTTIMTRSTIVHDAGMIKHRPDEGPGVMTDTAILVS